MHRLFLLLVALVVSLGAASTVASGQTTADYLKLRKRYKIVRAAEVAAIETTLGTRVLEIEGTVKGSFSSGRECSIVLERSDGGTLMVDSDFLPAWLDGGDVQARLLLRVTREAVTAPVHAKLLSIAPVSEVAKYDEKPPVPPRPKTAPKGTSKSYAPPKGGGPLYGPIGKGGGTKSAVRNWNLPASEVTPIYAGFIKGRNPRLSNQDAYDIAAGIVGFSLRYGVDARLIMAMVMVESGFDPYATSRVGAQGLGQLMPGTAKGLGVANSYDSAQNLFGTVKLVRNHLDTYNRRTGGQDFETLVLTLAAYNAGPGAVKRHGGVPPYRETQNYVRKVVALYSKFTGRG